MKITSLFAFLLLTVIGIGQTNKGKISYSMEFSSDNPDMAMYTSLMQGSQMTLQFLDGKTRGDVSMGTMGTITTIIDEKADQLLMLMDMMGQKTTISNSLTEMDKENKDHQQNFTFEKTNETKTIIGYPCYKAIMTTPEGEQFEFWYTNEIMTSTKGQQYIPEGAPGFPLMYVMSNMGMKITMTALSFEKEVDKKLFSTKVPEGYTLQTLEQLKAMQGQ